MCLKVNGVLSIKKWSEKMDRLEHPVIKKKQLASIPFICRATALCTPP